MMSFFNEADIKQLTEKGISLENATEQLAIFKKGTSFSSLLAAASVGKGILKMSLEEQQHLVLRFEREKDRLNLLKFVPASGAASRMFTPLFIFLNEYNPATETLTAYLLRQKEEALLTFFTGLEKFPFYEEVKQHLLKKYPGFNQMTDGEQKFCFVQEMLSPQGLHYGAYPKALLPFHRYENRIATTFEEHLSEAALYAATDGKVHLHFTITHEHEHLFNREVTRIKTFMEQKTGILFHISFSFQEPHTHFMAVTPQNTPFKDSDNRLCLYPSGHGALLENLDAQDADIIFIKNIDNVPIDSFQEKVAFYKKVLAGKLLEVQEKIFQYAAFLDSKMPTPQELQDAIQFLRDELYLDIPASLEHFSKEEQVLYAKKQLNRPLRVCGMVVNEGEPGGGPFWVKNASGQTTLQIIEGAQVDMEKPAQKTIFKNATHFNPVDVVCGVKNYKGEKYRLSDFTDATQGFISQKINGDKPIRVYERPGLWNGSMAHWNTIFVEVPLFTFNPVKTVNDLLKPAHQLS